MSVSVASANQHRKGTQREPLGFKAFAISIIVAALGLLAIAGATSYEGRPGSLELVAWIGLVAVSGFIPIGSGAGPRLAMDLPLLLALAFAFGPFSAGLIAMAGSTDIRELRREISLTRALWNRSQTAVSVMAASWTFSAIGSLRAWPLTPVAALVAIAADGGVNYVIVAYGTSLRTRAGFSRTLAAMHIGSLRVFFLSYLCFGFLGVLIAETYAAFGMAGVLGSLAPVVLGSMAFLHQSRLDRAQANLAATSEALRRVDERIAQERTDERSRIAEALHDEVLQHLYNVTIRAQILRQDLLTGRLLDLEDDLPAVIEASEAAVEDLRDVISGLRTSVGHAGLIETLTLFANHASADAGVRVVLSLDQQVRSEPDRELVVYQIAREAITNSLRHASARTVWVTLETCPEGAQLRVEDDGRGFDAGAPKPPNHFGLDLMHERAKSIGADFAVRSGEGIGTTVLLTFRP